MDITPNPIVSEWLSLEQLRILLTTGELELLTPGGTLRLYVNFIDRVSAQEAAKELTGK